MGKIKQLFITIFISIFIISGNLFAAEHHTSWNGDINKSYETINNNIPYFTEEEKNIDYAFEKYSPLDEFGRCGIAYANICKEIMPTEKRKDISKVYPSGWKYNKKSNNNKYKSLIKGNGYIYNRCHLIAHSLAGENDNKLNLITGTDYMNHQEMLAKEMDVKRYIDKNPSKHVLYRVTPIYEKDNLVAEGVRMEGWSVEDAGESICFNIFCYNIQPEIEINYKTGENYIADDNYEETLQEYKETEDEKVETEDITDTLPIAIEKFENLDFDIISSNINYGAITVIIIVLLLLIFIRKRKR